MARKKRDYYVVLGVDRHASELEIKRAFREIARKYHPDVSKDPASHDVFREANEAYAVLSDKDSRSRYDRWGHTGDDSGATGFSAVVETAQEMINDVLRRRRNKQKGKDLRYTLEISFEEGAFGTTKPISFDAGTGKRELTIVIPAGTKDGFIKTLKGEGERGVGGAGDLVVSVRVADHPSWTRDNWDVRSEHSISFSQAALGAVVDIPTLDGPIQMRIPAGTQPGRVFRIRGRGIPQSASKTAPRGDHLVRVQIEVPTELTAKQRELIEELAQVSGESGTAVAVKKPRLIDRVRSLLDE